MIIIGVDYHPSVQQVAFVDTQTGETGERRLNRSPCADVTDPSLKAASGNLELR